MSAQTVYNLFGIRGYDLAWAETNGDVTVMELRHGTLRCPVCRSKNVTRSGHTPRLFHHVPIGSKPLMVLLNVQRIECLDCSAIRQVQLGFADARVSYTKAFERHVVDLSKCMTMTDVAQHLFVSWDVVKGIVARNLRRRFKKPKLRHLQKIAIDEISIGHGQRYLTVVLDLATGAVVYIGDGKGAEALEPFWRRLRASRARVKAVAIDMSQAYIKAVSKNLPRAKLVFDRFHIVKLFNEKLSDFRRALYHEATEAEKKVLKGTRWLLLKNPKNLDEKRNEKERLEEALAINKPLATAYYMKEELRLFWEQSNRVEAKRFLRDWCARATASGIRMLVSFAQTVRTHESGILAWYKYRISTGPLEGTNNKIKTLQRQAYGYRDTDFFKLRIYAIHQAKWALIGA